MEVIQYRIFLFFFSFYLVNGSSEGFRDSKCFASGCIDSKNTVDDSLLSFFSGKILQETYLNSTDMLNQFKPLNYSSCLKKCTKNKKCISLNYGNESTCQILKENLYEHKVNLKQDSSWIHISMKSEICDKNPCLNEGVCVPLYLENSFQCACANGYSGKYCENSMLAPAHIFDFEEGDGKNTGYGAVDLSMNIKNPYGKVVHVADRIGKSLYCNGVTHPIALVSTSEPCLGLYWNACNKGLMVSFWVKFRRSDVKRLGDSPTIVMHAKSGFIVKWYGEKNDLVLGYRGKENQSTINHDSLEASKWNHIAIGVGPSGTPVKYFLNSVDMETLNTPKVKPYSGSNLKKSEQEFIWFSTNGNNGKFGSFFIDDVAFWRQYDVDLIKKHYEKSKQ